MSGLPGFLAAYRIIKSNGVARPPRSATNYVGATVTDDAANDQTTVTIAPVPSLAGGLRVTLSGASTNLVAGDAVCLVPGATAGLVTKATHADVIAAGGVVSVLGAVTQSWTAGSMIDVSVIVPNASSGLGAGVACAVGLSTTGRLLRATSPSVTDSSRWVGWTDTSGNVYVAPYRATQLDVRDFGAHVDGVHDDYAPLSAAIAAVPYPLGPGSLNTVFIPGVIYCSQPVYVTTPVTIAAGVSLTGAGGPAAAAAQNFRGIYFPPGVDLGLFYRRSADGRAIPDGSGTRNLTLCTQALIDGDQFYHLSNNRSALTPYPLNYCVKALAVFNSGTTATIAALADTVMTLTGLSGMTAAMVGNTITLSGGAVPGNNYKFLILNRISASSITVEALSDGIPTFPDANSGAIHWEVQRPVFFRATTPGTTASGGDPAGFSATAIGTTVPDGTVVWTSEAFPGYNVQGRSMTVGERCFGLGDPRYVFQVHTAGTAGDGHTLNLGPSAPGANAGSTFADGPDTLVWSVHYASLLTNQAPNLTHENLTVSGATGPGVYTTTSEPGPGLSFADFVVVKGLYSQYCGAGIVTSGSDANAGGYHDHFAFGHGIGRVACGSLTVDAIVRRVGTGGYAVWDRGLNNKFYNHYAQDSYAPGFMATGNSSGEFASTRSENGLGDCYCQGVSVIGVGSGPTPQGLLSGGISLQTGNARNIKTSYPFEGNLMYHTVGFDDNFQRDVFSMPLITGNYECTRYNFKQFSYTNTQHPAEGGGVPAAGPGGYSVSGPGWWARAYAPGGGRISTGVSTLESAEGEGHWRDYGGRFAGLGDDPYYIGVDAKNLTDWGIRFGRRNVGDRFEVLSSGRAGSWLGKVVSTPGHRALPWGASQNIYLADAGIAGATVLSGYPGTLVEPTANGANPPAGAFVYLATTGGVADTTEPAYVTFTNRFVAGATVNLNDTVVPTHARWNGYAYKATEIGSAPHHNGGAEPAWPVGAGATVTSGDVTYTRQNGAWGLQAGETTVDGTGVWTWYGTVAQTMNYGFVDDPIIAYEPRAHTRFGGGAAASVTNCIVDSGRAAVLTTDATANQVIETYELPVNSAACTDYVVVAKLVSGTGSACWKVTVGAERGASGAAVLRYTPTATLLWATDGLSNLVAGSVTAAVSAATGAIDIRGTGIEATDIRWGGARQGVEVAQ
jgi:hypothetical protein